MRKPAIDAKDALLLAGLVLPPIGVGMVSIPAAVVAAGLECLGLFILAVRKGGR